MTDTMTSAEFLAFRAGGGREKDPGRQMVGKRSQSQGKGFEAELAHAHDVYERNGIAGIDHLPVSTNPMPRGWLKEPKTHGGIARILSAKQGFDYYGTIGGVSRPADALLGRAVAMEAKATAMHKPSLGITDKGPLRPHQLRALAERFTRFHTLTAIVWRNGEERGVLLPDAIVTAWQDFRLGTRKSVPWRAFTRYPVHAIDDAGPIEDWLSVLVAWEVERR